MKPKFILSKSKAISQYNKVKSLADFVSYSSKTNPLMTPILEKETDSLFSIHMMNELKHVKDKSRVIFLAQAWTEESISDLIKQGIRSFVVDNEPDLDMLLSYLDKNNNKINLMLRIKLQEKSIKTERYFVFGMSSDIVNKRIKELRTNKNIEQLGVHFHRKSQNMSEWNLIYEFQDMIDKDTLKNIDMVNIGGGIPAEYANTNVDVIDVVFKKIKEFREFLNKNEIKMMIEPGRFIAAPSIKLITHIIGIHDNNIIIDASVYNSDLDALIVPVKLVVENEQEKGKAFTIKGITPCSLDLFRYRVYLDNPKIGDPLTFLNAGAYNFTSRFCDLEEIQTEIIE